MNKTRINEMSFLASNEYWGRGILIGSAGGRIVVAYFIMGRSENSRNRYFYQDGDRVAIAPFDKAKVEDPSLIIYFPIKTCGDSLIVTNGDQTDTIEEFLNEGKTFEEALRTREFEPDDPHFTPRISGIIDMKTGNYKLSILKDGDGKGGTCSRYFYEYEPVQGIARFIHTYEGNEEPLPTFEGEPKVFAISSDIQEFTDSIWNSLDDDNKISLCTMMIDPATGERDIRILNRRMGD
jgi:IMP cyclohydrolase